MVAAAIAFQHLLYLYQHGHEQLVFTQLSQVFTGTVVHHLLPAFTCCLPACLPWLNDGVLFLLLPFLLTSTYAAPHAKLDY